MVEPPSTIAPSRMSTTAARAIPSRSTPPWSKKRRSSTAIVALRIQSDIPSAVTDCRFRSAGIEPRREPSAAYRNVLLDRGRPEGAEVTRRAVCKDSGRAAESSREPEGQDGRNPDDRASPTTTASRGPQVATARTERLGIERGSPTPRRAHVRMLATVEQRFGSRAPVPRTSALTGVVESQDDQAAHRRSVASPASSSSGSSSCRRSARSTTRPSSVGRRRLTTSRTDTRPPSPRCPVRDHVRRPPPHRVGSA